MFLRLEAISCKLVNMTKILGYYENNHFEKTRCLPTSIDFAFCYMPKIKFSGQTIFFILHLSEWSKNESTEDQESI